MLVATNLLGEPQKIDLLFWKSPRIMGMLANRRRLTHCLGSGPEELALDAADEASVELPAFGFGIYELS